MRRESRLLETLCQWSIRRDGVNHKMHITKRFAKRFTKRIESSYDSSTAHTDIGRKTVASTMKDVARLAQVSLATVSAVLSGSTYVSPELTSRVKNAVAALGYSPNSVASSLKKGATKIIGLVVPDITNPFFTELVHSVQKRARELGYAVLLCDSERDMEQERSYLKMLRAHLATGTIICPAGPDASYKDLPNEVGIMPIVSVDHIILADDYDSVVLDNVAASRMVMQHIISLGHTRVAIIAGQQHLVPGRDRLAGFVEALRGAGLDVIPEFVRHGAFNESDAFDCSQALLALPERPSAIFAANNQMLIGVMRAISESGLSCPYDISVAAIDDFPWAAAFSPALTTVRQPVDAMADAAFNLLLERINGTDAAPRHLVFPPEMVIRQSCVAPAAPSGLAARRGPARRTRKPANAHLADA
ncbi:LacI family DNA-binding transcriptional regulator [Paraburkholderia youngii]|uniref:LacI family transcriptional regulator n=1 Tax=Paraburkholderia youngii TaxID=2782701 RepID=A0ABX2NI97_9BURK|nr:LacI family DNA-binding transcriptional regulator [Paraburkholderia youngii]NVI03928.1 LacI family transcriptional regulator [Paraburkholderia youngii]